MRRQDSGSTSTCNDTFLCPRMVKTRLLVWAVRARGADSGLRVAWGRGAGSRRVTACSPSPQTLDVSAALACTELLTRDRLKPSPQEWLRSVKNLSVPLGLLCSDGYLQGGGGAANAVVREVR